MRCISCGKEISINAKICPFCQRDTTASSQVQGEIILLALVGGGLGYLVNGFLGAFIGAVLVGGIGGAIRFLNAQKKYGSQPSTVQIARQTSDYASLNKSATGKPDMLKRNVDLVGTNEMSPSARLQELENLKAKSLLTESEYNAKRSQILNDL